jgi:hypothetical protein
MMYTNFDVVFCNYHPSVKFKTSWFANLKKGETRTWKLLIEPYYNQTYFFPKLLNQDCDMGFSIFTLTYRDKQHKVRLQRVRPWSLIKNWALLFAPKGIIGGRVIEIRHSFSITVYKPSNICISTIILRVDFAMIG